MDTEARKTGYREEEAERVRTEANIFVDEDGQLSKWGGMKSMRVRALGISIFVVQNF